MGSGPYQIKSFEPGRTLTMERVKDYWGEKLPFAVGQNNFDGFRYEFFRDDEVELQAFKGDNYDLRQEPSAKNWATAYDFPAKQDGRVVLGEFPQPMRGSGVMTGLSFRMIAFGWRSAISSISKRSIARFSSANMSTLTAISTQRNLCRGGFPKAASWRS
jgi:hypothetical protein